MSRLRDLSIRAKLSASFSLSLALIFAIGAISLVLLWGINALATRVTVTWLPQMETLGEIKRAMAEHYFLAQRRTNTTNFRQIAADSVKMQEVLAEFDADVRRFAALSDRRAEDTVLARFRGEWAAYLQSLETVFSRIDAGDPDSAQDEFDTTTRTAFVAASKAIDDLLGVSRAEGRTAAENVQAVYGLSLAVITAVLLLSVLIVGGAIRWISSNVSKPILSISHAMERLTAGDESVSVSEGADRKDEIGVLVAAVTGYRGSLNRIRHLADEANRERQRLNAALTNMSQGLCMFDADEKLVIYNSRYAEIVRLSPEMIAPGMTMRQLMTLASSFGKMGDVDVEGTLSLQQGYVRAGEAGSLVQRLTDGRSISISHRPMPAGGFVVTFEDITERLQAEEKIRHLAQYDALTDLPNRVTFYERLELMLPHIRRGESIAILSLDLDHFKNVNDTLGHPIGDLMLKAVAERMRSCIRGEDFVARLGGDEFAVVQVPSGEPRDIPALASRLIEVVGAPYELEDHQIVIGLSIGVAIAPSDGNQPDVLMKNADLALYRAKADGGGTYRFFEAEMDARMQARRALELDLRKAVLKEEFEVHYQPIIDVRTQRITSCEALVRWRHPERGLVMPLEFIPVAEATGLIVPIGEWVLEHACAEALRWPKHISLSVNLSPAQFKSRNLVQSVIHALARSGLPAARLELEITERVLLQETEGTFAILHQLRDLGISIAMDDFGTGYSSLSYLRNFPFSKIKIDQTFIRDLPLKEDSVAIVRAVVGLSSSLGITTIAEGVETKEQLDSLTSEGCNEAQGFLFSQPKPAAEVEELLQEQEASAAGVA